MASPSLPRVRLALVAVGALLVAVTVTPASAQSPSASSPPVDRSQLEGLCQANAKSSDELATCLDIVARVLVPTPFVEEPIPVTGPLPFEPIELSGKGDKVARVSLPADVGAVAEISNSGKGYFGVQTLGSDGESADLLVNTVGKYKGSVLIDQRGAQIVALEISSDGKWKVTIVPVLSAESWDTTNAKSGKGDQVLLLGAPVEGFATVQITGKGKDYFGVHAYTAEGDSDLLVNEIAPYEGEVIVPEGTALLEIRAGAGWTLSALE
jgi:hypothetical protein